MSSLQPLQEKLQLKDQKNLLLQGLPLAIEKQFLKFSFSKNVTPLLKSKKIDFALVFAFSSNQLKLILQEVIPALHAEAKFWVAYPKASSKIASDLSRDANWSFIEAQGFETESLVAVDNLWNAVRFIKTGSELNVVNTSFSSVISTEFENEAFALNSVSARKALQTKPKKQKEATVFL